LEGTLPTELGLIGGLEAFTAYGNDFVGAVPKELCDLVYLEDTPSSSSLALENVEVNCAVTAPDGVAEILCPAACCTRCCDRAGLNCYSTLGN
jgi:hypothetical protein